IKDPEVIILDEPTLGIDPRGVQDLLKLIHSLSREEGLTVLLSSHHLHQVQEICDRVGLFVSGKLLAHGNIETLSQTLFSNEPFVIEARVSSRDTADKLVNSLYQIDGVLRVTADGNKLDVGSARDASAEIARAIVESGADLTYLLKKEYGLDDIYDHYFREKVESYA